MRSITSTKFAKSLPGIVQKLALKRDLLILQSHRDKLSNRSSSLSIIPFHGVIKTPVT